MTDAQSPAITAQSGRIIEMVNQSRPMWFCEKVGRDFGNPAGGWTTTKASATEFTQEQADELLETSLASVAPFCQVVPK